MTHTLSLHSQEPQMPLYMAIAVFVFSFFVGLLLAVPLMWLMPDASSERLDIVFGLAYQLSLLMMMLLAFRRFSDGRLGKVMAWVKPRHALSLMLLGSGALVAQEALMTLIEVPESDLAWIKEVGQEPGILLALATIMLAPITEELFFRQMLWQPLVDKWQSPSMATMVCALAWAALHTQYSAFVIAMLFINGLLFGYVRHKSSSVLPCIGLHMLMNGLTWLMVSFELGIYA